MAGRSAGPASRPPRRGSGARPAARGTAARTGAAARAGATGRPASAARASARTSGPGAPVSARPSAASPATARVVRRTSSDWRGRVGGAVTHRVVRRAVVLGSIMAFLAVLLASSVAAWVHQRTEIQALRDRVAAQEADVAALRAERERWNDPAYVEQQARQRLKFVRPGERSYTVLDPQPQGAGAAGTLVGPGAGEAAPARPWYGTVWESVLTADAPGARR